MGIPSSPLLWSCWYLPLAIALVVGVAFAANNNNNNGRQERCPSGKGICVRYQHCLANREVTDRRTNFHKCFLEDNQRGVCCDREKTTRNRKCATSRGGGEQGQCVAEDLCGGYTRDFLVKGKNVTANDWWKKAANLCYQEKQTKYYCCPPELLKTAAPTNPPTRPPTKGPVQPWDDNAFPTCQISSISSGRCVPLRLCNEFLSRMLKKNPRFRYEILADRYKCPSDTSDKTTMCCPPPASPDNPISHPNARKLLPEKCGTIGMQDRIIAGSEAALGTYPWMANLMYYRGRTKTTLCSGTLIHKQYVLTAAHCSKRETTPISVRLGEHDLSKETDCAENVCAKPVREYGIAQWIQHEKYNKKAGQFDIALVRLDGPAMIIPGQIYPICLPVTERWLMMQPSKLIASGWGLTKNDLYPDVLMHATLQTLSQRPAYCQQEQMICARGTKGEGHCSGDSGGPLQQIVRYGEKKFRMVLFGVISGGSKSCSVKDSTAGLSVSVGYHIRWILGKMKI